MITKKIISNVNAILLFKITFVIKHINLYVLLLTAKGSQYFVEALTIGNNKIVSIGMSATKLYFLIIIIYTKYLNKKGVGGWIHCFYRNDFIACKTIPRPMNNGTNDITKAVAPVTLA